MIQVQQMPVEIHCRMGHRDSAYRFDQYMLIIHADLLYNIHVHVLIHHRTPVCWIPTEIMKLQQLSVFLEHKSPYL